MSVDLTVSPFASVTGRVYRDYGVSAGPLPDAVPGSGFVVFTPVLLAGDAAPVGVPQAQRVMAPIDPATGVVGPVLLWAGSWQVHVPGATMPGEVVLEAGQSYDLAALRGYVPGPGVSVTTMEVPAPSGPGYLSTDGTSLSWADAVDSVNGRTGTVVLGAADVGAEPAGSMAAHTGAADPHPQYLTPAEGDGRYLPASYSPPAPDMSGYVQTTDARLSHLDLDRLRAAHATSYLTTPTYDGSGQAVHPDVLVLDEPFGGYRYWMAMTPYPNTVDTWENPSILCSDDGISWAVPAGLTNPIDRPTSGFYPDPCLLMDGDTLRCFYADNRQKSSTDGSTWSARQTVTFGTYPGVGSKLSPSVVKVGAEYHYWGVDSGASPNVLYHATGTDPLAYGDLAACTLSGGPAGRDIWHVAMRRVAGGFIGAFTYCDLGVSGANGTLHLATSADGESWVVSEEPLLAPDVTVPWAGESVYRSCIVPTDGTGGVWGQLWYSAYGGTSLGWHIGYTLLRASGPESIPEMSRLDKTAMHDAPVVINGDSRNRLPDADLLRPASGNLVPYGWTNNLVGGTGHAWYPEDESWSVVIAGTTSGRNITRVLASEVTLVEGEPWTFSVEARSDLNGNGTQRINLGFQDSGGTLIGTYAIASTTSTAWKRLSVTANVPAGAAKIVLLIVNAGTTTAATRYWWRRAQLEQAAAPTTWTPGPTAVFRAGSPTQATPLVVQVSGPVTSTGSPVLMGITKEGAVFLAQYTTALRPAAATVGKGGVIYDTTLNLPIFSDGSVWKNMAGTAV